MIDSKEDFENTLGVSFSDNHVPNDDPRPSAGCFIRLFGPLILVIGLIFALIFSCNNTNNSNSTNDSYTAATSLSQLELPTLYIPELPSIDISQFETSPSKETHPPVTAPTSPTQTDITLRFVSYPKSVRRNEETTVTIKGKPHTKYSITVEYSSGPSSADGLESKYSSANGYVSWTWHVGGKTNPGTFTITVSGGGETKTVKFHVVD